MRVGVGAGSRAVGDNLDSGWGNKLTSEVHILTSGLMFKYFTNTFLFFFIQPLLEFSIIPRKINELS